MFRAVMGQELHLDAPETFNEKMQWLKLYDRRPEYTMMVDKYAVRNYIREKLGEEYLIPLLGVWEKAEDIDFDQLPDQFVLKCNHNSGLGMCVCNDKSALNLAQVRKKLNEGLAQDYYLTMREWPYRDVPRRIVAEELLTDPAQPDGIMDYKLMCFNGKVQVIFTCTERFSETGMKMTFFDADWNQLPFTRHYPASTVKVPKPQTLSKMIALAEMLAQNQSFLRIDFYEVSGKVYFGEITFFPSAGMKKFTPQIWDKKLGDLITLPKVTV